MILHFVVHTYSMSGLPFVMFSQLFIVACVLVTGFALTVDDCPSNLPRNKDLQVFGNKCYRFFANQKKQFEDAEDYCSIYDGTLAMVKTKAINEFIRKAVRGYGHYYGKVWIGLRYNYDNSSFVWEDGSLVHYHNFDQRRKFHDDCIFMKVNTGTWLDHDCDTHIQDYAKHYFVCEYPLTQTSNSSEVTTTGPSSGRTTSNLPEMTTTMLNSDRSTSKLPEVTTTQAAHKPTCATIVCVLDCGMEGYAKDQSTGCIKCACNV